MPPDLWDAISRAMELRKKALGGAIALPSSHLFITRRGKLYTKESSKTLWVTVRRNLGLDSREITFHDMQAKAA